MSLPAHQDVALITGAGRGLGMIIAQTLAKAGYRVCLTDIDGAAAEQAARLIDPVGDKAMAAALDVTDKAAFDAALQAVCAKWGGVGILVNNAALTKMTPIFDISQEEFAEITNVNLGGTFLGCQTFGRYFSEQNYGRIINLASLAAQNGGAATGAHYAASKGGIVTLTKVFARDLAAHSVTVNAISPGPLDVELVHNMLPPEKLEAVIGTIPVKQLGDPEFIGQIVALLASPAAASMTGATIDANGGLYVR